MTCIGNHEFDYGWENILEQFKRAEFPILMETSSLKGLINCYGIIPMGNKKNNIKIGVIGLHGKFAFYDTVNPEMAKGLEARDEHRYLQKYIDELRPITDLIIPMAHHGRPRIRSKDGKDVEGNLYSDLI